MEKLHFCHYIIKGPSIHLPNGDIWAPKFRATCQTVGVIYLMKCSCGAFYVSKTKRNLFCRMRDHVSAVSKKLLETPISRHMGLFHDHNLTMLGFYALEHIPLNERGGDADKRLLQDEAKWIYTLQATRYPGLNQNISYKPFCPFSLQLLTSTCDLLTMDVPLSDMVVLGS